MASFKTALQALGEGRVSADVIYKQIHNLLSAKPELVDSMLNELEQAYQQKIFSSEAYTGLKSHINQHRSAGAPAAAQDRTIQTSPPARPAARKAPAPADAPATETTPGVLEDTADLSDDIATEINAAMEMMGDTGVDMDFDRPDSMAEPGTAPAATDWAKTDEAAQEQGPIELGSVIKHRFKLLEVLGQGGMGKVYKGIDLLKQEARDKNPYVAIKLLNEDFKQHPESFIALQRESSRQQKLAHPNIATVYDFDRIGTSGTQVYITMELMEGQPINTFIKRTVQPRHGLPFEEAFPLILGLGKALQYAHAQKIVHSDFKPGNTFLCKDGTVKVLDFGIARAVKNPLAGDGEKTLFDPGKLGALTPAYASLEMLEGEDPDPRDDIYALGCVSYELFTGKHPYNKIPANAARDNKLTVAPIKGLKRRQMQAMQKALAFERKDRVVDVAEFLEDLEGKSQWHKNPWIIGAGAAFAIVLGSIYPAINYLHERKIDGIIESINTGEAAVIRQIMGQFAEFETADRSRISEQARDVLQGYFEQQVGSMASFSEKLYDFPGATLVLNEARAIYPDSLWLKEFSDQIEDEKSQLLYQLNKQYILYLEQGNLIQSETDEEITDVLAVIAQIDPMHALLEDQRLTNAYLLAAENEVERNNLQAALDYTSSGLTAAADDAGLLNLRTKIEQSLRTAELEQIIGASRTEINSLPGYRAINAELIELARLSPNSPLLTELSTSLKGHAQAELDRILKEGSRSDAEAAAAEYGDLLNALKLGHELSQLKLAHLSGQERENAIQSIVGDAKEELARLIAQPGTEDAGWEAAIQGNLQQLGSLLPPQEPILQSSREQIMALYTPGIELAYQENRFAEAHSTLDRLEGMVGPTLLEQSRAAVAAAEQAFNTERERQVRLAQIEGLKQDMLTQAKARDVAAAGASLEQLRLDLPADDPFLTNEAPPVLVEAYLKLADGKARQNDYEGAVSIIRSGLQVLPDSVQLQTAEREYLLEIDVSFLDRTFDSQATALEVGAINSALSRVLEHSPERYAQLQQKYLSQVSSRINSLQQTSTAQAMELLANANLIFPNSAELSQIQSNLSWDGAQGVQEALQAGRLNQAEELLATAPAGNAGASALSAEVETRRQQAGAAFLAFTQARDAAGDNQAQLNASKAQLEQAQALWQDNPDYAAAARNLEQQLQAASTARRPKVRGRETDIAAMEQQVATATVAGVPGAGGDTTGTPSATAEGGEAPAEVAETVATVAPTPPWQPRSSAQPCTSRLAGYGKRAKAICFDVIGEPDLRGPLMVVVPKGEAFATEFAISKYEISINDYNKYCFLTKSCQIRSENKDTPVTQLSIEQAETYANWLSERTGKRYRMPTAAEWEYAASAGGKQPEKDVNCRVVLGDKVIKGTGLASVKSGKSNGWGLKNYIGNVQEWVRAGGELHVRGGSYSDSLSKCDIALDRVHAGSPDGVTGFRLITEKL